MTTATQTPTPTPTATQAPQTLDVLDTEFASSQAALEYDKVAAILAACEGNPNLAGEILEMRSQEVLAHVMHPRVAPLYAEYLRMSIVTNTAHMLAALKNQVEMSIEEMTAGEASRAYVAVMQALPAVHPTPIAVDPNKSAAASGNPTVNFQVLMNQMGGENARERLAERLAVPTTAQ